MQLFQGRGITQALDQFLKLSVVLESLFPSAESAQWLTFPASPMSPHAFFNTAHSEEEEYKGTTHICFLSDSGVPGRMFRILSISGSEDRVGSRDVLCHSSPLQNLLYLSLEAKLEVYCTGC